MTIQNITDREIALAARVKELEEALRNACFLIDANKLTCHHLHHSTKDFHEWDEPCGVEAIAKERLESVRAAMGGANA